MNRGLAGGALLSTAVFAGIALAVIQSPVPAGRASAGTTAALGRLLLTQWVLPFEVLAVLFVAALLGALYLARVDE